MIQLREFRYGEAWAQARHEHEETQVTLLLAGMFRERVGQAEALARPLSIVVKPSGLPHANEFAQGVHTFQIKLSGQSAAAAADGHTGLRAWNWSHAGPAVPHFLHVLRLSRLPVSPASNECRLCMVWETLAAITPIEPARTDSAPVWLRTIREALDDGEPPPAVSALAADAGVHPVYLARQFRRWYGCSVTQYLQRRRASRTAHALAQKTKSLAAVAHASGFADQAHMNRQFKRASGLTPSAFRTMVNTTL